jgi:hypothetical protein
MYLQKQQVIQQHTVVREKEREGNKTQKKLGW